MNTLLQMQAFVAVADAGSFVGAAEDLGLSKAAISRHVSELESRLGVRLLHRTTRRLSLTEEGQLFLRRSRELLADLAAAEGELSARGSAIQGTLRVNAPVSFGIRHLAPLWPAFQQQHPQLLLDITLADRVVDLLEEGVDLAIRIGRLADSSLISRRLAESRVRLCASPDYLRRHGHPQHPRELAQHLTIGYSYWSGGSEWRFEGPEGEVAVRTQAILRSNNGETCVAAALAGQGIALQPDFLLDEALGEGRLVELMPEYRAPAIGIHAVYPNRKHLPPKVRALVSYLAEALGGRGLSPPNTEGR